MDCSMEHERQARLGEPAEQLLAFAERVAEQYRRLIIVERLPAKADHPTHHLGSGRKSIVRATVSRLHDENIRLPRFAALSGKPAAQFEITGVKQRLPFRSNPAHGASKNMSRWKERHLAGNSA